MLFDFEIEIIACMDNRKTRKRNQLTKLKQKFEGNFVSLSSKILIPEGIVIDQQNVNNNGDNGNNNNNGNNRNNYGIMCHNSQRNPTRLAQISKPSRNEIQTAMKTRLRRIIYASPFCKFRL